MKKQIFLYLFLFAALYIVFQYMNAKKAYASFTEEVKNLEAQVDSLKKERGQLLSKISDLSEFTLKGNDAAITYFVNQGKDVNQVVSDVKNRLIAMNSGTEDHPLVPFTGIEGPMMLNSIVVLNNHWVMANFTDGKYWGEVLIRYYYDSEGELQFETLDGVLYSRRK